MKTQADRLLQMTPLCLTWHLLWDRVYGPRIQERLKSGGILTHSFCSRVAVEAKAELVSLGGSYAGVTPKPYVCYQCDTYVSYLLPDARCVDCTRLTPEEVRGEDTGTMERTPIDSTSR